VKKIGGYFLSIALLWLGIAANVSNSYCETLYAYTNEDGVRVFTNVPPGDLLREAFMEEDRSKMPDASQAKAAKTTDIASIHELIKKYSEENDLDPFLIRSIIETESGFNHKAVSSKGACGLMQLMPATARHLGVRDSFDPEDNIRGGVRYFRTLMDMFNNDLDLSLAAYNAGENLVRRLGRVPDYKETQEYVKIVKSRYGAGSGIIQSPEPEQEQESPLYRYVDESGVLHLTNVFFR